jgi:hypothetical protein
MSLRLTGERQRRITGITSSGIIVPFFAGAEDDDTDQDQNQNGSEGGSGDGSTEGDGGSNGDSGTDGGNGKKLYTEEEVAGFINKMKAADKRASDYEKKINDAELATKSEIEQAKIREQQAQQEAKEAREELKKARIHNKFLASNKYTWHDPETALKLLDLGEVEVADDGAVKGLDNAIKTLADAKPFLLKQTDGDGGDNKQGKATTSTGNKQGSTGNQPAGNKQGKDRDKDRARLLEKYPALNR